MAPRLIRTVMVGCGDHGRRRSELYLQQPFYTSTNFGREPNGSKWNLVALQNRTHPRRSRLSRSLFRLKAEATRLPGLCSFRLQPEAHAAHRARRFFVRFGARARAANRTGR